MLFRNEIYLATKMAPKNSRINSKELRELGQQTRTELRALLNDKHDLELSLWYERLYQADPTIFGGTSEDEKKKLKSIGQKFSHVFDGSTPVPSKYLSLIERWDRDSKPIFNLLQVHNKQRKRIAKTPSDFSTLITTLYEPSLAGSYPVSEFVNENRPKIRGKGGLRNPKVRPYSKNETPLAAAVIAMILSYIHAASPDDYKEAATLLDRIAGKHEYFNELCNTLGGDDEKKWDATVILDFKKVVSLFKQMTLDPETVPKILESCRNMGIFWASQKVMNRSEQLLKKIPRHEYMRNPGYCGFCYTLRRISADKTETLLFFYWR